MVWKMTESDYVYIEEEVRLYPLYKKRLREAVGNIIHSTPERDTNGGGKSNGISRPTENIVFNLFSDSRIMKLQRYVDAIEFAYNELDDEKQQFIQELYWNRHTKTKKGICSEFNISISTYDRWKKGFLLRVGLITGDKREML
jgi:RinA family phage transcriptional activator